jgi:hypothetical protein
MSVNGIGDMGASGVPLAVVADGVSKMLNVPWGVGVPACCAIGML